MRDCIVMGVSRCCKNQEKRTERAQAQDSTLALLFQTPRTKVDLAMYATSSSSSCTP